MSLEAEIQVYRRQIATDAYPMSIGELSNLYRDGEIDIHPEFQRIFRWTNEQKTRLIESILLGIPLPSIFVAQNEKGIWDVVDGVQRLSTIFQFMGILKDDEGDDVKPFVCGQAPFLKSIEGMSYESEARSDNSLDSTQRLDFKRARIDVKIIKRESDKRTKYDLFQRLNSFGSIATEQELRNCLLVSLSKTHFDWLSELADNAAFKDVLELPSRLMDEQYHMELALRFIVLRRIEESKLTKIGNIGEYLTAEVVEFTDIDDAGRERESAIFNKTFSILHGAGGPSLLRRWDTEEERPIGPFSLTAFETLALGIGYHNAATRITPTLVRRKRSELWSSPDYQAGFSTGQRADQRMRKTIPLGRQLFS
ncbi:DUF262 domain-containing protein [Rhodococcus triatomae]